MSDMPNKAALDRAIDAARRNLSPEDAAKVERLAHSRNSLQNLTASMSEKDWVVVNRVLNDPDLLRKVLGSSKGKNALHEFLKNIP